MICGMCYVYVACFREKDYKKFITREDWREFDFVTKFSESKRAKLIFFFVISAGHWKSSRNGEQL